jgi:hypothetical protein
MFLLKIAIFSVLVLVALLSVNESVSNIPNDLSLKYRLAKEYHADNVILGSSHGYFGVNPKHFVCPTINLAYASQDLEHDNFIINSSQKNIKNSKQILIEMSYHSLPYMAHMSKGGIESTLYNNFWNFDKYYSDNFLKKHFPLASIGFKQSMNRTIKNIMGIDVIRGNSKGWANRSKNANLQTSAIEDTKRHNALWNKQNTDSVVKLNLSYVEDIILFAKQNNITPILFNTPIASTYRERMDTIAYLKYLDLVSEVSIKHNVDFHNFIEDQSYIDALHFADSDHLNKLGAQKFSHKLNQLSCYN